MEQSFYFIKKTKKNKSLKVHHGLFHLLVRDLLISVRLHKRGRTNHSGGTGKIRLIYDG